MGRPLSFLFALALAVFARASAERPLFDHAELRLSAQAQSPRDGSGRADSVSGAAGGRVVLRCAEGRAFWTMPRTPLGDVSADCVGALRWGVGANLLGNSAPVSVRAGSLSFSRSLARLRSPAPSSSANPLSSPPSLSAGLGASLPSLSSSERPAAISVSARLPASASAEAFVSEGGDFGASASVRGKIGRGSSVAAALTFSRAFVENGSAVLKKAGAGVEGAFRPAALAELSVRTPPFRAELKAGAHGSPFGGADVWLRADASLACPFAMLGASLFAVPTRPSSPPAVPLVGQNSSVVRTFSQASLNPQVFVPLGLSSVRLGANALVSGKIAATKGAEELSVGKFRAAAEWRRGALSVRADFTRANVLLSGEPPNKSAAPEEHWGWGISAAYRPSAFAVSADAGLKVFPPYSAKYAERRTLDARVSVSPCRSRSVWAGGAFSASFSGGERTGGSVSGSLSFRSGGKIRVSAKVGAEVKF